MFDEGCDSWSGRIVEWNLKMNSNIDRIIEEIRCCITQNVRKIMLLFLQYWETFEFPYHG
jgi:hypothetical protein